MLEWSLIAFKYSSHFGNMALSRHFRVERQVPSFYFMVTGAILIGFFLITVWVLSPTSEVTLEESGLATSVRPTEREEKDGLPTEREEKGSPNSQTFETPTDNIKPVEGEGEIETKNEEKGEAPSKVIPDEDAEDPIKVIQDKDVEEDEPEGGGVNPDMFHSDKKVDDDKLPEVTTAAESELTTENKETPKNWSTQVLESNEEKKLVKVGNETDGNLAEREEKSEQNVEGNVKDESDKIEQAEGKESEHLQGEGSEQEQFEERNRDGQVPETSDGQPVVGEQEKVGKSLAYEWKICKWQGAVDYIPCLDNKEAIQKLPSTRRFQHRERHCPSADEFPLCLVPLPEGYRLPIRWPRSRDEIWFNNVPHPKLVSYKKDQNWVRIAGDKLIFPGGGTQFKLGASNYIESIEKSVADVAWGKHTRVVLDIGCGVASFGGYLFEKDVLTMSFAPKDEHEAQVQLALERGIPAISAVMGTQRLVFPSNVYDLVHCARCRIHWHGDGGKLLVEVNRVLRPGGYFVWSATPVYRRQPEDIEFWNAVAALTESMCWKLVRKTKGLQSGVGFAIYQKPTSNSCYEKRTKDYPPICSEKENPDAAWYTPLENCLQKIPTDVGIHGAEWPPTWPERLDSIPGWLNSSQKSLFGQPAAVEFQMDTEHWRRVIDKSYLKGFGIDWGSVRNVMDMKAGYGGFAAALTRQSLWVMNVVPIDEPDTLPVIFDRGLFGIYHDWCESFSTYPRTYDLLHVDHLFKRLVSRCKSMSTVLEMDRILRPEGWVIFRDKSSILDQILPIIESLHWVVRLTFVEGEEKLLVAQKGSWRSEDS